MTMRWGERFRLTIFGSSHGPEVGVEIEGIAPGRPSTSSDFKASSTGGGRWAGGWRPGGRRPTA